MNKNRSRVYMLLVFLQFFVNVGYAHVTPLPTRVIYHGENRFSSVEVRNDDPQNSYGLESWVSDSNPIFPLEVLPNLTSHRFMISPKFTVVPPKNLLQTLHILKLPEDKFPQDRESLYYLEFQEAPPKETVNQLLGKPRKSIVAGMAIAVHSQIKMMYRPEGLPELSESVLKGRLTIKVYRDQAVVDNQSPYVLNALNLYTFRPTEKQLSHYYKDLEDKSYIAHAPIFLPFTQTYLTLKKPIKTPFSGKKLYLEYINDYGGYNYVSVKYIESAQPLFKRGYLPKNDQVIGHKKVK